jgi:hypothetical protein
MITTQVGDCNRAQLFQTGKASEPDVISKGFTSKSDSSTVFIKKNLS